MKTVIKTLAGGKKYISLPTPLWTGREPHATGVTLLQIFFGPVSRRAVIHTYSCWDDGYGRCVGDSYREIELTELADLCDRVGVDVPDDVAAEPLN